MYRRPRVRTAFAVLRAGVPLLAGSARGGSKTAAWDFLVDKTGSKAGLPGRGQSRTHRLRVTDVRLRCSNGGLGRCFCRTIFPMYTFDGVEHVVRRRTGAPRRDSRNRQSVARGGEAWQGAV